MFDHVEEWIIKLVKKENKKKQKNQTMYSLILCYSHNLISKLKLLYLLKPVELSIVRYCNFFIVFFMNFLKFLLELKQTQQINRINSTNVQLFRLKIENFTVTTPETSDRSHRPCNSFVGKTESNDRLSRRSVR